MQVLSSDVLPYATHASTSAVSLRFFVHMRLKKGSMGWHRLMVGSGMATGEWTGSGKWQEVQEAAMEIPPSLQQIESNDLTKIKELGRGQFGSVWLCRCARF